VSSKVKIALAQISLDDEPESNLGKTLTCIDGAASKGADLILFPESQFSPYFPVCQARREQVFDDPGQPLDQRDAG